MFHCTNPALTAGRQSLSSLPSFLAEYLCLFPHYWNRAFVIVQEDQCWSGWLLCTLKHICRNTCILVCISKDSWKVKLKQMDSPWLPKIFINVLQVLLYCFQTSHQNTKKQGENCNRGLKGARDFTCSEYFCKSAFQAVSFSWVVICLLEGMLKFSHLGFLCDQPQPVVLLFVFLYWKQLLSKVHVWIHILPTSSNWIYRRQCCIRWCKWTIKFVSSVPLWRVFDQCFTQHWWKKMLEKAGKLCIPSGTSRISDEDRFLCTS